MARRQPDAGGGVKRGRCDYRCVCCLCAVAQTLFWILSPRLSIYAQAVQRQYQSVCVCACQLVWDKESGRLIDPQLDAQPLPR